MNDLTRSPVAAALEHLTGRNRGQYVWITGRSANIWLTAAGELCLTETAACPEGVVSAARITREGEVFDIEAPEGARLWVNGAMVRQARLAPGDMIEFGESGPLSRFRVFDDRHPPRPTVAEILDDMLSYLRSSRRPLPSRAARASGELTRRLIQETTLLFRITVVLALLGLSVAVVLQYRSGQRMRAEIETGGIQVEAIASELAQTRRDAIRHGDLAALREDLRRGLTTTTERLETLEARSDAGTRVIRLAAGSIAFLQGGYGLRHRESGRMLRQVVNEAGVPILTPGGQPLLSLEGNGPVAEVQFNGTGFMLKDRGVLVTNRHVALPWDRNPGIGLGTEALEPVMTRFIAYFPGRPDPIEVQVLRVSDVADLALLQPAEAADLPPGLAVATAPPVAGEGVIVMGYPTGLMSLLMQSGAEFIEELQATGETGFWAVAARLAAAGLISPLASRGIIGQATAATIVYDAETTHGGSGGPVLNLEGEVVAVNTAIMPEFGGSNLGVPARHIPALVAAESPGG